MIISSVSQVVGDKSRAEVQQNETVLSACKVMCEYQLRALLVMNGDSLVGVLSESDVIRKCICDNVPIETTTVAEIMTVSPQTLDADASLADAIELMKQGGFHHAPVLKDDKPIGMLSNDDIPEEYRMLLERFKEMSAG